MGFFDVIRGLFDGGNDGEQPQTDTSGSDATASAASGPDDGDDADVKDVREFGAAEFRQEAEDFADDHDEQGFDFSIESLERLDEYAASQTEVLDVLDDEMDEPNELTGGLREGYILWFGSYFGEVLVRQLDGEWVTEGDGVHVEVPASDGVAEVPPLDAAAIAVEDEPQFATMASEVRGEIERAESGADPSPTVQADDGGDVDDGGDRGATVEPPLPEVDLEPGSDLDAAHERAVDAFEDAGYYVTEGTVMNSVEGPLSGTAKLFNFHDDAGMYTGVVYTGEWTDDVTNGVLSLASSIRPDPADGVFVVSANEPPAIVRYVTGAHPRTAFALEAMTEVQNGPEFDADSVEHYAEVGRDLLATHFGVQIDVDDLDDLETLDDVVLSELRTVEDHEQPQEGYTPHEALIPVGALAGQIMGRAIERDHDASATWTDGEAVSSTGVAMTITGPDGGSMTINPVGKAFKLFENGSEDSLPFMYETSVGVLHDEL